jgi:hypothetical protein
VEDNFRSMMKNITIVSLLFWSATTYAQEIDSTKTKAVFVHKSKEIPAPVSPNKETKLEANPKSKPRTATPVTKSLKLNR